MCTLIMSFACVEAGEMNNLKKENKKLKDENRNLKAALEWVDAI